MMTLRDALDAAQEKIDTTVGMADHDLTRAWQDGDLWVFLAEAPTREPTAAAFVLLDLDGARVDQVPDWDPDTATEVSLDDRASGVLPAS